MIKWDEPIQATDGRHARVIARLPDTPDDSFAPTMVWITSDTGGFGDVFLVNNRGVRCDDRALFSMRQEPIIRNVPVKREGWINVYGLKTCSWVFETEIEAKESGEGKQFATLKIEWKE
jgi:hypothetical protein